MKRKDKRKDIAHSKIYFQQLLSKHCSQKHLKQLEINQEMKSTFFGRSVSVSKTMIGSQLYIRIFVCLSGRLA